ncbi:MAG: phosphoenolpyruvate carboxylase [Azospirillaceae bacterium]|nr:phosphoenolpyruvate carboxylase [Azospirillaceae bacterium]
MPDNSAKTEFWDQKSTWPLLEAGVIFPPTQRADLAGLASELATTLERLTSAATNDPFANPVQLLAIDLSRRLHQGTLDYATIEQLIQYLSVTGFVDRAARLADYLGTTDEAANDETLTRLVRGLAERGGEIVPFESFRDAVSREVFGIVFTAHPTFNLSESLMRALTTLALGRTAENEPPLAPQDILERVAARPHQPDTDLSLTREHGLSLLAIGHAQDAIRRLYRLIFEVAETCYPDRWTELRPRLITIASWVGYDLDGRSDIHWTDTLRKRLVVQVRQLRHYRAELRAIRAVVPSIEEIRHTLDLLESRLALAINETDNEIAAFSAPDAADASGIAGIQHVARRMHEGRSLRLIDSAQAIELVDRILRLAGNSPDVTPALHRLCVLRAELANYGLGMAHTHVRINATQLHNAIRKAVALETAPEDPRYRQSYLTALNELLDKVQPVTINFGSLIAERTSAKRLFMIVAQMLRYADAATPVRFLIAECESAFTTLTALYYARLFGIADQIDISPLFETEKALEAGSRIIDQLLDNPHYRAYVLARGRLCIQTGFSDAGRYLGQTPASASIERLRLRLTRLLPKHGLTTIQLIIFDTHGESIGRGAHPGSFRERLDYISSPYTRAFMAEQRVKFKQEVSFQGGDGYQYFITTPAAFAVVTRILEQTLDETTTLPDDPFYQDPDYITEFFTTVKEFQVSLMTDSSYGVLLHSFGANLLFASGSRALKRQHESTEDIDHASASQIRAIPHNAILQQLGLPANTVGGVGAAIDKDPRRFTDLYQRSPRFRLLIGMVEYGVAIAAPDALRAYIDALDPATWLLRAAHTDDRHRADEMLRLAAFLEDSRLHVRKRVVFRKLYRDFCLVEQGLERTDTTRFAERIDQTGLKVLHAIRLALMHEVFLMATHIPPFSSQHSTTWERVMQQILHLDVQGAVDILAKIFPSTGQNAIDDGFGETATYVSDETQNYSQENERLLKPLAGLHSLIRRVGSAITQRIGFFG